MMFDYNGLGRQRPKNWSDRGSSDVDDIRFANQAAQLRCSLLANDTEGQKRVAGIARGSLRDENRFKTRETAGREAFSESGCKGENNRFHSTSAGGKCA